MKIIHSYMPEREPIFSSLTKGLTELLTEIKKKSPDIADAEAIKQAAQKALEEQEKAEFQKRAINEAKKFRKKIKEGTGKEKHDEQVRYRNHVKSEPSLPDAINTKKIVQEVLQQNKKTAPEWLKIDEIVHNPDVAEFAVNISLLPEKLQSDPNVIFQELARLYNKTPWTELTFEAHKETKDMIQRAYDAVLTKAKFDRGTFVSEIDNRPDFYRMNRLEPLSDPGEAPKDKNSVEFKKWEDKRVLGQQRKQLDITLNAAQRQFDSLADIGLPMADADIQRIYEHYLHTSDPTVVTDIDARKAILKQHQNIASRWGQELSIGQARTVTDHDVDYLYPKFTADAQKYVDFLDQRKVLLDAYIDQIEQMEQQIRQINQTKLRAEGGVFTFEQARKLLKPDQYAALEQRIKEGEQRSFAFQHIKFNEAIDVISGPEGQQKYIFERLFDIHGQGREKGRPTLMEEYEFKEFENFFKWIYGKDAEVYFSDFRFSWSEWGRQDYILKTLMYEPGDVKDKLLALRRVLGADVDRNAKIPFANDAIAMYAQVVDERQMEMANKWQESVKFLRDTPVSSEDMALLRGLLSSDQMANASDLKSYDQFYLYLRKLHEEGHLPNGYYGRYRAIEKQVELNAKGTILTDEDMLVYNEVHNQVSSLRHELDKLEIKPERTLEDDKKMTRIRELLNLKQEQEKILEVEKLKIDLELLEKESRSPAETQRIEELKSEIRKKSLLIDYMTSQTLPAAGKELSAQELSLRKGYSPLELEVRERIVPLVEAKLGRGLAQDGSDEWMLRRAVVSARFVMIGTGHLMTKASLNVIKPLALSGELDSIGKFAGKSVMWAPFMEDVVRILNPDYFEERFGMGSPWAESLRAIRKANYLKTKEYGFGVDLETTPEYAKYKNNKKLSAEEKLARAFIDFARAETGIESEYMLSEGSFRGGGAIDISTWRPEAGLLDELKAECERTGHPHAWKNMALWLQVAMLPTTSSENIIARRTLLNRSLDRSPSNFFHMLGGKIVNEIKVRNGIEENEWQNFMRALSVTETQLWQNWEYASNDIILRGQDFNLLKQNLLKFHISEDRAEVFKNVLTDLYTTVTTDRNIGRAAIDKKFQYKSIIEAFAHHNFPVTISYADMDWSVANFFKLSTTAFDRRGRDNAAQLQARDIRFELDSNPAFVRPQGEKGVEKWIEKLQEYKTAVNTYDAIENTEAEVLEMVRQCLSFNRSRVKDIRNILGWIPGSGAAMRWLAEQEPENLPILRNIKPWKKFLENNELVGKKIKHWPHSVGEAVSLSVKYFGAEAEDWDRHRIDHIVDMLQHAGIFGKNSEYYGMLRREYGTTFFSRLMDIPRKYWWVIPAGTIAVAAMQSTEDAKHEGSGH